MMINPALEQICTSEEHAELIREKALHYVAIAEAQLGSSEEELETLIPKVMFTLFACGFGEGVRAGRAAKN